MFCMDCSSLDSCMHCFEGFALLSGECVDECPGGYYEAVDKVMENDDDMRSIVCERCPSPCETCTSSSTLEHQCLSCT